MVRPSWVQTSRPSFTGAESSEQFPERGDTFAPVRAMNVHCSACAAAPPRNARNRQQTDNELRGPNGRVTTRDSTSRPVLDAVRPRNHPLGGDPAGFLAALAWKGILDENDAHVLRRDT